MKFGWRLPSPAWPNVATPDAVAVGDRARSQRAAPGTRGPRHADVLHPHGPLPLERAEREAAGLAKPVRLGRVRRADDRASRPPRCRSRLAASSSAAAALARQVGLDEEHRRGVAIEPELEGIVDREDRLVVQQLERDRHEPGRGDRGDGLTGGIERREEGQQRRPRRAGQRVGAGASPR